MGKFFGFSTGKKAEDKPPAPPAEGAMDIVKTETETGGQVKPLNAVSTDGQPSTATRMFLGNDTMYIFFRYLQFLVHRLEQAKEIVRRPSPQHHGTPPEEAVKEILGENKPDPLNPPLPPPVKEEGPDGTIIVREPLYDDEVTNST